MVRAGHTPARLKTDCRGTTLLVVDLELRLSIRFFLWKFGICTTPINRTDKNKINGSKEFAFAAAGRFGTVGSYFGGGYGTMMCVMMSFRWSTRACCIQRGLDIERCCLSVVKQSFTEENEANAGVWQQYLDDELLSFSRVEYEKCGGEEQRAHVVVVRTPPVLSPGVSCFRFSYLCTYIHYVADCDTN